jgi:GTPase
MEYKLKLVHPTASRFEHLVTQLKWRLQEGQGEAIYEIGIEDNGTLAGLSEEDLDASIKTLHNMATTCVIAFIVFVTYFT